MKKTAVIIGFAALLAIGCNSDKRRYEIVTSPFTVNNTTFIGIRVLDTYTGDVWGYTGIHRNQDSNWMYSGNPTKLNIR